MGIADAILDLVSSGTTLKENNLKEIEGCYGCKPKSIHSEEGSTRHYTQDTVKVTANMRGSSTEEAAERVLSQPSFSGLQGPTVSPVLCKSDGIVVADYYAIAICVPKKSLYKSVKQLRAIGGSGVLISPLTYIFMKIHQDGGNFSLSLVSSPLRWDMGGLLAFHIRSFEVLRYHGGSNALLWRE